MGPLGYLHLQLRLEGKELIQGCMLRQVEVVPGEDIPILLIAQLASGEVVACYDEAISSELRKGLSAHVDKIDFPRIDPLLNILESHTIPFELGHYKTYVFPSQPAQASSVMCLSRHDPMVKAFGFDGFTDKVYAVETGGVLASACVSARENAKCGEAWVYTSPEHRHQGLAQKVVQAWARSLIIVGKVPLYSHKIENTASANLAVKLGLQPVFEEIAIIQVK